MPKEEVSVSLISLLSLKNSWIINHVYKGFENHIATHWLSLALRVKTPCNSVYEIRNKEAHRGITEELREKNMPGNI
jgi:hypothetical protein